MTDDNSESRARSASYHNPDRLLRRMSSMHRALTDSQVVVAVRVRPLNDTEKEAESQLCTTIVGPGTIKITPSDGVGSQEAREFNVDAVVHSDAPQETIFKLTAKSILSKVFAGYNGCIFAYGQTGSGKTYSMIGGSDPSTEGVIPRTCRELFSKIESETDHMYVVKGQFLEIYQEKIKDLLAPDPADWDSRAAAFGDAAPRSGGGSGENLVIRHDKSPGGKGIYVTGVREHILRDTSDVLDMLAKGTQRRVVGSTNMNATSSRSHAVLSLTISCQNADDVEGFTRTVSKLHLVDLAGSERAKATGATGARLREGASINKSLAALGNVVNSLTSKTKSHTPYRDSKLTRLLQDSLGGNAYTLMICCVSPAEMNSAETMSSLRFAERTKKIKNCARVNRDPKLARIAELTEENQRFKKKIKELERELEETQNKLSDLTRKPSIREKSTSVSPETTTDLIATKKGGCCVIS